jgi:CRISPR system Cascade subunit CasB
MTTGDIAELRRMNPERPAAASFWTFMMRHGVTNSEGAEPDHPELEKTWARIVRCIARDTKVGENHTEGPHLGNRSLGEALANAGYSEERLKALLNAKDETMLKAVEHAAHFLSSKQEKFNWNQGAALMMTEHRRSEQQDGDRVRIARDYYRAVNNRGQKE